MTTQNNLATANKLARQSLIDCKRLVIKIGTSSLTTSRGALNIEQVQKFTEAVSFLKKKLQKDVLLVTSGAIGAGVAALGFTKRPTALPHLQMAAAVGQSRLMSVYSDLFAKEEILCAQVLLTHEDLKNRARHVNAVNTFEALLSHGVIPIINENDAVAVDEIKVGDNDTLAAMVAIMSKADLLVLLTTSNGVRTSGVSGSPRIPFIESVSPKIVALAQGKTNQFSTGGMKTKLLACKNASRVGIASLILDSLEPSNIYEALSGKDLGTLIGIPITSKKVHSKKRYMGFFQEAKGTLILDDGASKSLSKGSCSLLAVGIIKVSGTFKAGSVVELRNSEQQELGRGRTAFSSTQIKKICGLRTDAIRAIDEKLASGPVVHKDQMLLIST